MKKYEFDEIVRNARFRMRLNDYAGAIDYLANKLSDFDLMAELILDGGFVYKDAIEKLIENNAEGWNTVDDLHFKFTYLKNTNTEMFREDKYGMLHNIDHYDVDCLIWGIVKNIELEDWG